MPVWKAEKAEVGLKNKKDKIYASTVFFFLNIKYIAHFYVTITNTQVTIFLIQVD